MARKRNQGSNWIRKDKRIAIYLRDGMVCVYCGAGVCCESLEMVEGAEFWDRWDFLTKTFFTLDHVVPCEAGGGNQASNLVTACLSCNSSKRDAPLASWAMAKGRDPRAMARKIRKLTETPLGSYRKEAKQIIARRNAGK